MSITCELTGVESKDILVTGQKDGIKLKISKGKVTAFSHFFDGKGIDPKNLDISFLNGFLSINAHFAPDFINGKSV